MVPVFRFWNDSLLFWMLETAIKVRKAGARWFGVRGAEFRVDHAS